MIQDNILILGTGAMATLFAARLAPFAEVTLLGTWQEGVEALKSRGVTLIESDGSEKTYPVQAETDPKECKETQFALVLVKSWQTERAANQLAQCLSKDGLALTLQNGYGNLEALQSVLGTSRTTLGVTTTGATLLGPGRVRAGGVGSTHVADHPSIDPMVSLLQQAGFEIEVEADLDGLVWGKLIINAGINPLTALLEVPNGALLEDPHARALMGAAAEEAALVAQAYGARLPFNDPVRQVEDVAKRTAKNHSSMLQDIVRGAPTEIDAINGAIAREGERLGLKVPVNWTLWRLVRARVSLTSEL